MKSSTKSLSGAFLALILVLVTVGTAFANAITGPSSSQSPYIVRSQPGVVVKAIFTVGDSVNLKPDGVTPYRMVGIPDGLGAYDNGNGTFTLLMNHEIPNNLGTARAHGNIGAFISQWIIETSTLRVVSVRDFIGNQTSVFLSNNNPSASIGHTGFLAATTTTFSRLCSADLPAATAYHWTDPATGIFYGTDARIFQSGEGAVNTLATTAPEARVDFGRPFTALATED